MPLVKTLRSRGSTIVVEANAEVLVMPDGDLARWKRNFSRSVTRHAKQAAPTNKRPRWGHYGKPLKSTITSSSTTIGMRMHFAVGATANHALFVDQGTKSFEAKILPPWTRQSPSLYEHTWKVPVNVGRDFDGKAIIEFEEVGKIRVRGQRAQHFMDAGIKGAFAQAHVATVTALDSTAARGLAFFPPSLTDFVGATPADAAFRASLSEWRAWRDEAWYSGKTLGMGYVRERERREYRETLADGARERRRQEGIERRRPGNRRRQQEWRDRQPKKPRKLRAGNDDNAPSRAQARAQVVAEFRRRNPQILSARETPTGLLVKTARGQQIIPWIRLYNAAGLDYRQ